MRVTEIRLKNLQLPDNVFTCQCILLQREITQFPRKKARIPHTFALVKEDLNPRKVFDAQCMHKHNLLPDFQPIKLSVATR